VVRDVAAMVLTGSIHVEAEGSAPATMGEGKVEGKGEDDIGGAIFIAGVSGGVAYSRRRFTTLPVT
jgi:hypothetical protein